MKKLNNKKNRYNVDSPFHDYRYWQKNPWNRNTVETNLYVQYIWATDYCNFNPLNGEDPW